MIKHLFLGIFFVCSLQLTGQSTQQVDSVKLLINKEKNLKKKVNHIRRLGDLYVLKGNYDVGLKHYLTGLRIAESKGLMNEQGKFYNNISVIYSETDKTKKAIFYAKKALEIYIKVNNNEDKIEALNSLANAYYADYQDSLALKYFHLSLEQAKLNKDSLGTGVAYRNLGAVYGELEQFEKSIYYAKMGLKYLETTTDEARIFSNTFSIGEIYLHNKEFDSAAVYYKKSKLYLDKHPINQFYSLKNFYEGYSYLYAETGDYQNAFEYYKLFNKYKDSIYNKEAGDQLAELQTKYDTEKKESRIKNQKNLLDKEKSVRFYLYLALTMVILLFAALFFWNRSRQKQQLLHALLAEKQSSLQKIIETEEKERSRIAKDLHDGIVQELTSIKLNLMQLGKHKEENLTQKTQEIIKELDRSTKDLREISYQMMPVTLRELGLVPALEDMLQRAFTNRSIQYELEQYGIEERFSEKIEVSLFRVCQELVNNVIKHSQANFVSIMLSKRDNFLTLIFEDNGLGFDTETTKTGIGMSSLKSRIEMVHGDFRYESGQQTGTTAIIRIPIIE